MFPKCVNMIEHLRIIIESVTSLRTLLFVCRLVGWFDGLSVCHNYLKGKFHFSAPIGALVEAKFRKVLHFHASIGALVEARFKIIRNIQNDDSKLKDCVMGVKYVVFSEGARQYLEYTR